MYCLSQIDKVGRPSWQAQISGRKKWKFVPVPECAGICKDEYEVIVEKGDISEYIRVCLGWQILLCTQVVIKKCSYFVSISFLEVAKIHI